MPFRKLVQSWSNARLLDAVSALPPEGGEVLAVIPTPRGAEEAACMHASDLHACNLHSSGLHAGVAHATGLSGWHWLTLPQLAMELARAELAAQSLAPLTNLGAEAISARVVDLAQKDRDLGTFSSVAAMPGFGRALSRTLNELRLAFIRPEDLEGDLAALLARYEEELAHAKLADTATVLGLASSVVRASRHHLVGLPIRLFDPPADSAAHRSLLKALVEVSQDVVVGTTSNVDFFERALGVPAEPLDDAEAQTSLDRLRQFVFEPAPPRQSVKTPGVEIFSAPGEGLEAAEIARRILSFGGDGVAFDEIAILLRNPDRYQPMIEEALRRARIPAYFSKGAVRPDPSGRAFLALLHCAAEKCSASRFAEYLSLGQVPPVDAGGAPVVSDVDWAAPDELATDSGPEPTPLLDDMPEPETAVRAPHGWERLLVDAAVIGGKDRWVRRLKGLDREVELRATELDRTDPERAASQLKTLAQLRHLESFALPLIELLDSLPRWASWGVWLERLRLLARTALRKPEAVLATLAELEPMADVGPVGIEELAEVLGDRLRFLRREPPNRRWGRVFVGSIDEARGRAFQSVFVPGMAEGLFPQKSLEDPLLLDQLRRALRDASTGDAALKLREDRSHDERTLLRVAIASARDRFTASYPRMDAADARPRVPSFYALELPRALTGALPELEEFERGAREAAQARLNWPAPANEKHAIDEAEYDLVKLRASLERNASARHLMEQNPHLARSLRARWLRWESPRWSFADGLVAKPDAGTPVNKALAEYRLAARAWSASALEEYANCPYKFALRGVFNLRPREEATPLEQLDPLTRGALFHEIQFGILGEMRQAGLLPLKLDKVPEALGIADEIIRKTGDKYAEDLAPAIPRVWASELEDLRMDVRGWLQHVARNDYEWEPWLFEFAFGLERRANSDPASTTEFAQLAEGVRLKGSIDLVEKAVGKAGALRITDHKTGRPPEQPALFVGGGRALQPLLYSLAASQLLGQPVEQGRLFYATQRGGYNYTPIPVNARSREFLAKLLSNIDGAIESGFLPAAPDKDACEYCDYRPVCGPYEELRFAKNKDRRDERLEPLFEIRGFA